MEFSTEIPKTECKLRGVYKLNSRNLRVGVWDGRVFIGIRNKFNSSYLAGESHWDDGAPYGTAKALEYIGQLPDDIEAKEGDSIQEKGVNIFRTYKPLFEYLKNIK